MWRCRVRVVRQDGLRPRNASNICSGVDVCNLSECQVGDSVRPNPVRYTSLCCLPEKGLISFYSSLEKPFRLNHRLALVKNVRWGLRPS